MTDFEIVSTTPIPTCPTVIEISGCVRGLGKDQDVIFFGESCLSCGKNFQWGVLMDGHGSNKFIDIMKSFKWQENMSTEDPWENLLIFLKLIEGSYGCQTGSTLLMIRAFDTYLETWSIGDSTLLIYKNGEKVYENTPHNLSNPSEVERLSGLPKKSWKFKKSQQPFPHIRNPTTFQSKIAGYLYFDPYLPFHPETQLAMSQAIGHNNTIGYAPEKHIEHFESSDKIRCILGSDGLFDMTLLANKMLAPEPTEEEIAAIETDKIDLLTMSAEQLCDKTEARWRQEWTYLWHPKDPTQKMDTTFGRGMDDVSVIIWEKK